MWVFPFVRTSRYDNHVERNGLYAIFPNISGEMNSLLSKDIFLESTGSTSVTAPTIQPLLNTCDDVVVHYSVVIPVTTLVVLLFVIVFIQLLLILYFEYKLLSYQTVFLASVLLWAGLRLVLYSFYYDRYSCQLVNRLDAPLNWFLIAFPQTIQFFTLALLVHYFGQLFFKTIQERIESRVLVASRPKKLIYFRNITVVLWVAMILVFFASNLGFSLYLSLRPGMEVDNYNIVRVSVSETLFLIMAFLLALFIIIIYTTSVGRSVLEAQRTPKYKAILLSLLIVILYTSRCLYNIVVVHPTVVALSYGYGWTNASDLADNEWTSENGYISYFIVLLIWEVLPTYLIVLFFRVKLDCSAQCCKVCHKRRGSPAVSSPRSYFIFSNPKRYDSDEEEVTTSINKSTRVDIPRTAAPRYGYGYGSNDPNSLSVNQVGGSHFKSPAVMPGTSSNPLIQPGKSGNLFSTK